MILWLCLCAGAGVERGDINVTVDGDVLRIGVNQDEVKEDPGVRYHRHVLCLSHLHVSIRTRHNPPHVVTAFNAGHIGIMHGLCSATAEAAQAHMPEMLNLEFLADTGWSVSTALWSAASACQTALTPARSLPPMTTVSHH